MTQSKASDSDDSEDYIEPNKGNGANGSSVLVPQPEQNIPFLVNPQPEINYVGFNNAMEIAPLPVAHVQCACPCLEILKQIQQGKF